MSGKPNSPSQKVIQLAGILIAGLLIFGLYSRTQHSQKENDVPLRSPAGPGTDHSRLPERGTSFRTGADAGIGDPALAEIQDTLEGAAQLIELITPGLAAGREQLVLWIEEWQTLLKRIVTERRRKDLLALVPVTASYFSRNREGEPDVFFEIGNRMQHPASWIIVELGKMVEENDGELDLETAGLGVAVFSVRGFEIESDWEDRYMPLDAAGLLISNPGVLPLLEALSKEELQEFLGCGDVETFFRRYTETGDGLAALKRRFQRLKPQLEDAVVRLFQSCEQN